MHDSTRKGLLEWHERQSQTFFGPRFWNGLIGSFRGDEMTGTVWAELHSGRVAALHGPKIGADEPATTAAQLVGLAIDYSTTCEVRLVQALKRADEEAEAQALVEHGVRHVADLLYMHADGLAGPAEPPPTSLRFEPYSAALPMRMINLIERTYVESLDCPIVDGLRTVEEILEGYRATGSHDPHRWLIATARLEPAGPLVDVGCILLAVHPLTDQWELMYMGVVPEGRGRGWGLEMVRHAQGLARTANAKSVVLAVDAANEPGVKMYAAAGFEVFDRRALHLRVIDAPA